MVAISIDDTQLAELCRRWRIAELALFGSVLRDDFQARSDVDVLVTYLDGARWGLFEHLRIEEELSRVMGRPVDLVSRRGLERSRNKARKKTILDTAERIYVAG